MPYSRVWPKFRFSNNKGIIEKFLWAPRLRVGREKEPISSYLLKIDEKNNSVAIGKIDKFHALLCSAMFCSPFLLYEEPAAQLI